jgi:hypothetical protein
MNGVILFVEVCDDRSCLSSLLRAHLRNRRHSGYRVWMRSALRNAGWTTYDRTVTIRAATITVVGWVFLAIALASADAYRTAVRSSSADY